MKKWLLCLLALLLVLSAGAPAFAETTLYSAYFSCDDDGLPESELAYTIGDVLHLLARVLLRVARIGPQLVRWQVDYLQFHVILHAPACAEAPLASRRCAGHDPGDPRARSPPRTPAHAKSGQDVLSALVQLAYYHEFTALC